ncbi:hypothetical protein HQ544_02070 [Candidatus Falkowbacteria bacterium]|nr:hypothetical protein [Candidatus Falkowbacteria bacterium]
MKIKFLFLAVVIVGLGFVVIKVLYVGLLSFIFILPGDSIGVIYDFEFNPNDSNTQEDIIIYQEAEDQRLTDMLDNYDDTSSFLDEREIKVWVNKDSVPTLTMEVWGYIVCTVSERCEDLLAKEVELKINGKQFFPEPGRRTFAADYYIPQRGMDKANFKVELNYRNEFINIRNIEVNWLSDAEFGSFKEANDTDSRLNN